MSRWSSATLSVNGNHEVGFALLRHLVLRSVVSAHSVRYRLSHACGSGVALNDTLKKCDLMESRKDCTTRLFFDLLATVCRTQYKSTTSCFKPSLVWTYKETMMSSSMEKGHHHPHRSVKAWSGAFLLAASLDYRSLTHRSESVERIISPSSRASGENTRSAASGAWPLSRGFHRVEGSHLHPANVVGSYQLVIAP